MMALHGQVAARRLAWKRFRARGLSARAIRRIRGALTLSAFAMLLGVTCAAAFAWERGMRKPRGPAQILMRLLRRDRLGMLRALRRLF